MCTMLLNQLLGICLIFLKQVHTWFLEIAFVWEFGVCVCVCVYVCASMPKGIHMKGMHNNRFYSFSVFIWHLLLINLMSMVLVTLHIVNAWLRRQSWCPTTSHRKRCFNYLAVATRQSASFTKVSGQMHSNAFKRRLAFGFTVIH